MNPAVAGDAVAVSTTRPRSFRPASRSRVRIVTGVSLALIAVGVVLTVFATVDRRVPVLQLVRDVPAGSVLTASDLRVVEVSADPSLSIVPAERIDEVTGQHAKVRMVAGALLATPMLQPQPLVAPGAAVLAVVVDEGELPIGLRERSRVLVVVRDTTAPDAVPRAFPGQVVGLPSDAGSVTGARSVSVEVAAGDAVTIVAAADVRLVLIEPSGGSALGMPA